MNLAAEEAAYSFDPAILLDDPVLWESIVFNGDHNPGGARTTPEIHSWLWPWLTADDIRYLVVLLPAGCGKSELVTQRHTIYEICRNPNTRIAIIQKRLDQAQREIQTIQRQMLYNPVLTELYGPFKSSDAGYPWSDSTFRVAGNSTRENVRDLSSKTNTVHGFGSETTGVLGYRFDIVKPDDVCTDDNSHTPEAREKLETKLQTEWEPTLTGSANGRLMMVGTAFAYDDLYLSKMRDEICSCYIGPNDWRHPDELTAEEKKRYVVIRKDAEVGIGDNVTIWPGQYSPEDLDFFKAKNKRSYEKRYRNRVQDEDEAIFLAAAIDGDEQKGYPGCLDKDAVLGEKEPGWRVICGADPASGKKTGASAQFAHVTLGIDDEDNYHLIDLFTGPIVMERGENYDTKSQMGTIIHRHHKYGAVFTVIEDNSQQHSWITTAKDLDKKMGIGRVPITVKPHNTNRNKVNPEIGVESMAGIIESGQLRLPYGDPRTRKEVDKLIEQLTRYPDYSYTDLVMALWFAVFYARKRHKAKIIDFDKFVSMAKPLGKAG